MKKRMRFLALFLALTCVAAAGCGSSKTATADGKTADGSAADAGVDTEGTEAGDASDEADRTQLIVGFDAEYPPYGYMDDNGEYVGFDLDLAKEVCDRNGWELVKQPIDWDSKDMELNSGSIDCIWNGFTMTGREDAYTWSKPYVDNSIVIVVNADSDISSLSDLAGKVVVTQADSSALAALTDDSEDNADNLALTASFADLQQVADYNTAFMNRDAFKMLDEQVSSEQYAVGFKKGNTALCDKVQATLDEMQADGTIDKIAANYADYNVPDMLCLGK